MSNILVPIVARYSVFFTLAMFSSSSISQSRHPTSLVQSVLLEAQHEYEKKSNEKLRALIQQFSTTSTSSSFLSQSVSAPSQVASSGSTEILSPSSSSPFHHQNALSSSSLPVSVSHSEPPSSPSIPALSLTPVLEQEWVDKGSVVAHKWSSEYRIIKDQGESATLLVSALERPAPENDHPNHNHNSCINHGDSLPCLLTAAAGNASVSSDPIDQQQPSTLVPPTSIYTPISIPSPPSSLTAIVVQVRANTAHTATRQGSKKVNKSSIAALLSVTLTMILLSLLQSKKRHIRRKGRSPRGTTSRRLNRGSKQLLQLHQEGYKSVNTDQSTHRSHSPSSSSITNNNSINLLSADSHNMEGTSSSEGVHTMLTQYRPSSFFGGQSEPTVYYNHQHLSSLPLSSHGQPDNNNILTIHSSSPSHPSPFHYSSGVSNIESTTQLPHQSNVYSGQEFGFSLSESNLPDKRSKRDFVADWLDQQIFVSDMIESPEILSPSQDDSITIHDNENIALHSHPMQHQRSPPSHQQSFPEQLDPSQTYQHSINNTGAQRELRHQGQEHYDSHSIRRSNEFYLGSRTSLYRTQSTSRHSMMALDQFQSSPQLSQQQQQQQQQGLRQDSSYQHRPPYPYYPQQQQKQQAPHPPNQHPYYQRQYQPASLPSFRPPPAYEPYGLDDYEQQDYENHRTLSLNNSGGRGGRSNVVSRPQSQFYRKVPPARFENLSLAEQARQEHQMRRQHYQQHYHQHRQQQQQQQQQQYFQHHQQCYHTSGSRPESMYSIGYAAPHAHTLSSSLPRELVTPRQHHQRPPPPPPPPLQHQQARLQSDFRHSSASSVKSNNIGRSAHDLAWERHCYYQQQQIQEDALAERKRIEYQQQVMAQRRLSSAEGIRQAPLQQRPSPLVRTSSLSRLSNSSTIVVAGYRSMMEKKADSNMTMAHNSSSVLSRSVSTSAVMETRIKTSKKAEKDGVTFKNKESPASENDAKSSSDCKFFRLLKKSDSKFSKSTAPSVTVMNTETSSALTQIQNSHINGSNVTSRDQYTTPKIIGQPFESVSPVPKPATGLSRKKTLKELAGSLARRCSSRFNNSSRPSSFAGSNSDPVIRFTQGDQFLGGGSKSTSSLSLTTDFAPLHLTFSSLPRSLAPGPDGVVDLQQAIAASQGSSSISTSSPSNAKYSSTPFTRASPSPIESPQPQQYELQGQRVPIHRKVTLFRSKTISLPKSPSRRASHAYTDTIERTPSDSANNAMASNDNDDDTSNNNNNTHSTRANSLPTRRRQRDSLRLANGHGLNFDAFLSPTLVSNISTVTANSSSVEEEANAVERSTNDLESALPGLGLGRVTPLPAAIITNGQSSDIDQQQKARRQIISLLALGRKDRNTGKTSQSIKSIGSTSSSSTPTTATTPITPLSQLSPLALEAQDDLFVEKNSSDASTNGGEKKENEEIEKIAFMLVPKSRYEFQPLVVA